jgi:hypothetical protein
MQSNLAFENFFDDPDSVSTKPRSTLFVIDKKQNVDFKGYPIPEHWFLVGSFYSEQNMLEQFNKLSQSSFCKSGLYTYRAKYPDGSMIYTSNESTFSPQSS